MGLHFQNLLNKICGIYIYIYIYIDRERERERERERDSNLDESYKYLTNNNT